MIEKYAGNSNLAPIGYSHLTVRENIDRQIKLHQDNIDRLNAMKVSLYPLLDMKIADIQQAMNF